MRSVYEKVPSVETRIRNAKIIDDRVEFLTRTLEQFIADKEMCVSELFELQKKIDSFNYNIGKIRDEISCIKENYKTIVKDKDPVTRSRIIFRRFSVKCKVCNKTFFSKKDLMVHKFKKHSY